MDAQRWRRARELFDQLVDLPCEQWSDLLVQHCAGDAELEREVRELLAADSGGVTAAADLQAQAPAVLADFAEQADAVEQARWQGQRVGSFRLLRPIGRGGMGAVWLAERADGEYAQQVAIKLIRSGWDADAVMQRFRAERQILATLQHPNIAHLIDGGVTSDGKPWLALEYVDGVDLVAHCDQQQWDLGQRLDLFVTVCDAVAHAHARLVVHRDLKPSNILVRADGSVKLLDFGIAKLIDAQSAQISANHIFTPEYAAPEQLRGELVTTAVDVYALGLLLYELLTGRRPYHAENSTPAAYERAILDREPTRPSAAVLADTRDGDAVGLAARRDLTPQRLRQELRGDLDAIVLKALRKEPSQRYASVGDLVADIAAYREQRPVAARRGGWRYRAQRFVARHALASALAATAVLALCLGLALALWQTGVARQQRDLAQRESAKAQRTADFLAALFTQADPNVNQGAEPSARDLLDAGVEQLSAGELDSQPALKAGLLLVLLRARYALGIEVAGSELIEQAVVQAAQLDDPLLRLETLELKAAAMGSASQYAAALPLLRQVLAEAPRDDPRYFLLRRRAAIDAANASTGIDQRSDAERYLREAHALQLQMPQDADTWRADAVVPLAFLLTQSERAGEAEGLLRQALADEQAAPRPHLLRQARIYEVLAMTLQTREDLSEALALSRRALDLKAQVYKQRPHAGYTTSINNYGVMLARANRPDEAVPLLRQALALREQQLSANHPWIAQSHLNLGRALDRSGDRAGARVAFEQAEQVLRASGNDSGRDAASVRREIASVARREQRWEVARAALDDALARFRAMPKADPGELARTLLEREMLDAQRGVARADCAQAQEAVQIAATASRVNPAEQAFFQIVLAGCLADAGDRDGARARLQQHAATVRASKAQPVRQEYLDWVERRLAAAGRS